MASYRQAARNTLQALSIIVACYPVWRRSREAAEGKTKEMWSYRAEWSRLAASVAARVVLVLVLMSTHCSQRLRNAGSYISDWIITYPGIPWRLRRYVPPKHWNLPQKIWLGNPKTSENEYSLFLRIVAAHQIARCHQQITKLLLFFGVRSSKLIGFKSLLCILGVMVLMMMMMMMIIIIIIIIIENSPTVPRHTVTE